MPVPQHTIIQLTDTHIVPAGHLLHEQVDSLANVAAALRVVEAAGTRPDAVVFTGDLADAGQPDAYRRLRSVVDPVMGRLGVPCLFVPGNHDERRAFHEHLLGHGPSDDAVYHCVVVNGLRLIALDTTVPGAHHGALEPAQLDRLAEELATPAPAGTVLALHHPPVHSPLTVIDLVSLHDVAKLAEVVAGSDVRIVVAGHAHHASAGALAGIPVWVAPASAYATDVLAPPDTLSGRSASSFSRIDLYEDGSAVATEVPLFGEAATLYEWTMAEVAAQIEQLTTASASS